MTDLTQNHPGTLAAATDGMTVTGVAHMAEAVAALR